MKLVLALMFPFFMTSFSSDSAHKLDAVADEIGGVKICWKGPKGNKTCITVSGGKFREMEKDFMTSAFMAADNSSILLDMSGFSAKSFKLAESTKIDMCNSTLGLKAGTEIKVVNGYAVLK